MRSAVNAMVTRRARLMLTLVGVLGVGFVGVAQAQADATFACNTGTYTSTAGSSITPSGTCTMTGIVPVGATVNIDAFVTTSGSPVGNAGTITFNGGYNYQLETPAGGTFTNSGTIIDNSPDHTQHLYAGTFLNSGTIESAGGDGLQLGLGGDPAGVFENESGGTLRVDAGADITVNGPMSLKLDSGSAETVASTGALTVSQGALEIAGGSMTGTVTVFNSPVTFDGSATAATGALLMESGDPLTGTVPAGYTLTLNGANVSAAAGAANAGTLVFLSGNPTLTGTATFTNTGTISDQFTTGTAGINLPTLVNSGTISIPAGTVLGVGGALELSPSSNLAIGVSGTANNTFGVLEVSGAATLGGTLSVGLASSYAPAIGDKQQILTAGSVSGTFAATLGGNGAGFYTVSYAPTTATLVTGAAPTPAPTPAPAPAPGGGTGSNGGGSTLGYHKPSVKDGSVRVTLSCSAGHGCARTTIRATVTEKITVKIRGKKHTRRVKIVLGSHATTLKAGQRRTVILSLNRAGRRLLTARHRLTLEVTIATDDKVRKTYTVIVTQPRSTKKHHRK